MAQVPTQKTIILDVAAICISVIALVATIWQGIETRRYNKAAVRPYLDFYQDYSTKSDRNGVAIKNIGNGPAFFKKVDVYYKGTPATWRDVFDATADAFPKGALRARNVSTGSGIAKDEELDFFTVARAGLSDEQVESFRNLIRTDITLIVEYCSIDEDCWTLDSQPIK